jgi:hypothetical protein
MLMKRVEQQELSYTGPSLTFAASPTLRPNEETTTLRPQR